MDVNNETGEIQLSEHEQNMVDYVDNKDAHSRGQANPENAPDYVDPNNTGNDEGDANSDTFTLPEKFKSVEELLNSYNELEQKLHSNNSDDTLPTTEPEATDPNGEAVTTDNSDDVVTIDTYMKEMIETGELSEDSRKALNDSGVSDAVIDSMIEGQNAKTELLKADVYNSVGGEESYNDIIDWASKNLSDSEIDAFNSQISSNSLDTIKFALKSLQALQGSTNSKPGFSRQIQGDGKAPSGSKGYESKTEMYEAMRHPSYGKDASYTRMVENKIANSKI